jgi:NAD(P)-dependent dehydrogenase (short-subunit alcohol dehydrogenase family)
VTIAGNSPYHAAKWAVGGFSDSLADEVSPFGVKVCTLEPGGIRTNFKSRASKQMPKLLPDYEASVGPIYRMMADEAGSSESDPKRIADIVLSLSDAEELPKRLILGRNAETYVKQIESARLEEAAKYRYLTLSTAFTDID